MKIFWEMKRSFESRKVIFNGKIEIIFILLFVFTSVKAYKYIYLFSFRLIHH